MDLQGTSCKKCSGGFRKLDSGFCEACMDLPHWVGKSGETCSTATCSAEKFRGISSDTACCKCKGGHKQATKFTYYVEPMALDSEIVVGHPIPRTASRYSVNKDSLAAWESRLSGLTVIHVNETVAFVFSANVLDAVCGVGRDDQAVGFPWARAMELEWTELDSGQFDFEVATAMLSIWG
ncbi:unnamed protein product [Symbiodinium sp. CCMP2592]|nr:unnamed protein product [Symbiodinium sp. CCMP2592]